MGTLNDEILRVTGGPTVNDGKRNFFYDLLGSPGGLAGATLDDMERAFLRVQMPAAEGTTNDLWMQYLGDVFGYSGTFNDMQLQYWSGL